MSYFGLFSYKNYIFAALFSDPTTMFKLRTSVCGKVETKMRKKNKVAHLSPFDDISWLNRVIFISHTRSSLIGNKYVRHFISVDQLLLSFPHRLDARYGRLDDKPLLLLIYLESEWQRRARASMAMGRA